MTHITVAVIFPINKHPMELTDDNLTITKAHIDGCAERFAGEGKQTDGGWHIMKLDIAGVIEPNSAPYAYVTPDLKWHERQREPYPEEEAHNKQWYDAFKSRFTDITENTESFFEAMGQWEKEHPEPETEWTRQFHTELAKTPHALVAYYDCHR